MGAEKIDRNRELIVADKTSNEPGRTRDDDIGKPYRSTDLKAALADVVNS